MEEDTLKQRNVRMCRENKLFIVLCTIFVKKMKLVSLFAIPVTHSPAMQKKYLRPYPNSPVHATCDGTEGLEEVTMK